MKNINYFIFCIFFNAQCMIIDPSATTSYIKNKNQIAQVLFNHSKTLQDMANAPVDDKEDNTTTIHTTMLCQAVRLFNANKSSEQKISIRDIMSLHSIVVKFNEHSLSLSDNVYKDDYIVCNHLCIHSSLRRLMDDKKLENTLSFADYLNIDAELMNNLFAKLYMNNLEYLKNNAVLLHLAHHYLPHTMVNQTFRSFGKGLDSLLLNYRHSRNFSLNYDSTKSLYSLVIKDFSFINQIADTIKHIVDCTTIQNVDITDCTPEGYFDIDHLMSLTPCVENIELNGDKVTDFVSTSIYNSVKRVSFSNEYMDHDIVKRLFYIFPNLKLLCLKKQEHMVQPDDKLIKLPNTIMTQSSDEDKAYFILVGEISLNVNKMRWNYVCSLLHSLYSKG